MSAIENAVYYANLLILQYRNKAKARATVQALATAALAQDIYQNVRDAFDLDSAVGAQLTILGKWVGVERDVFDFSGPVTMGDTDFRTLINIKIRLNKMSSSLKDIDDLLNEYFEDVISVYDQKNMSISYVFRAVKGTNQLAEIFTRQFLPKPMCVGLGSTIYSPGDIPFFGFRTYSEANAGATSFSTYTTQVTGPWLSKDYALNF